MMGRWAIAAAGVLGTHLVTSGAQAQVDLDLGVDQTLDNVMGQFDTWMEVGLGHAAHYFVYFATMQMVWSLGWVVLGSGGLGDVLVTFTKEFARQGVFYAVLVRAEDWVPAVVDSLQAIGQQMALGAAAVRPEKYASSGVELIGVVWEHVTEVTIAEAFALLAGCMLLFLLLAWVSISYYLTLLDAKFVMAAGAVLLGLGGSQWTAGFARRYIEYAVRVGLKLLVLELLFGLFEAQVVLWLDVATDWSLIQDLRTMIAVGFGVLLMGITVWSVPGLVAGMASGALVSSGEAAVTRVATSVASSMAGWGIGAALSGAAGAMIGGGGLGGAGSAGSSGSATMSATERAAAAQGLGTSGWGGASAAQAASGAGGGGRVSGAGRALVTPAPKGGTKQGAKPSGPLPGGAAGGNRGQETNGAANEGEETDGRK